MGLSNLLAELSGQEILIPRLRSFVDKQAALERRKSKAHIRAVVEDANLAVASFKRRAAEYNHQDPATKEYFHPSSIGRCLRELWFAKFKAQRFPVNEHRQLESYLTFETGTYLHVVIQNLCQRAGVLLEREVEVLDHAQRIIGHADGILRLNGRRYLLEFKTINSRQFSQLDNPKYAHVQQATMYMEVLGLSAAVILYMNKDTAALREFVVPYSVDTYTEAVAERLRTLRRSFRQKLPPDREGVDPKEAPCTYCDFRTMCYSNKAVRKFTASIPEV